MCFRLSSLSVGLVIALFLRLILKSNKEDSAYRYFGRIELGRFMYPGVSICFTILNCMQFERKKLCLCVEDLFWFFFLMLLENAKSKWFEF